MPVKLTPPSDASMKIALDIANRTPEGREYFADQVEKIYKRSNADSAKTVVAAADQFRAAGSLAAESKYRPWEGDQRIMDIESFEHFERANENPFAGLGQGETKVDEKVTFTFAVSEQSDIRRAYTSQGKHLDDSGVDRMDKLLNHTLHQHEYAVYNGKVYKAVTQSYGGEHFFVDYAKDAKGDLVKADPNKVRNIILKGGSDSLVEIAKKAGLEITTKELTLPKKDAAPQGEQPKKDTATKAEQPQKETAPSADQTLPKGIGSGHG
jgi:hypothetical protein